MYFGLIPADTKLRCAIDDVSWVDDPWASDREKVDRRYVEIVWKVLAPEVYRDRFVFHKLRIFDKDTTRSVKALRMLSAIDYNAGGELKRIRDVPTEEQLYGALCNHVMVITVGRWKINGREGNWVTGVDPDGPVKEIGHVKGEEDFDDFDVII